MEESTSEYEPWKNVDCSFGHKHNGKFKIDRQCAHKHVLIKGCPTLDLSEIVSGTKIVMSLHTVTVELQLGSVKLEHFESF